MSRLSISLLGPFHLHREDLADIPLAYDKVRALLAYLALESDRPHRREVLADLLWPEQDERAARHSLSQALFSLRQSVSDHDATESLLLLTRDTVQLNRACSYWLDVEAFTGLLDEVSERQRRRVLEGVRSTRIDRIGAHAIEQATDLYRGPLLAQLPFTGSAMFDEWLLVSRESLQQQAVRALGQLVDYHEWRGDLERASASARRLLDLDSGQEEICRRLMRMLAATGQRAAALDEYERCRRALKDELDLEPEPETIALSRQIRDGLVSPMPSRPERGVSGHLPAQPALFVGRASELGEVRRLLGARDCRIVTLTGPGGTGKTQLAIKAALATCDSFAHGACFVSLAGLDTLHLLPHAIADALRLTFDGRGDVVEQLITSVRDRELLLVLDGFEHLLDGAGLLPRLLDRAPDIRVLVTSRERLDLRDEWVVEVAGLSLPTGDDLQSIMASSAAQLFLQCARKAHATRRMLPEETPAVARVCRILGGMPLGIELAASWAPVMTFAEIAAEVEASLDFLTARVRDMPERHRSMRAVFDQSWGRLTDVERRAFRRLAVFRGGFRRESAQQVTGATLPVVSALAMQSLVRLGADGRYEVHELLRQYGEEQLNRDEEEATATRDRHCRYFTSFLADREGALKGPGQIQSLAEISAEMENIRAAWGWAMRRRHAAEASAALHPLWLHGEITGRYRETLTMVEQAVEEFDAPGAEGSGDRGHEQALALGRALVSYGSYFIRLGDYAQGSAIVERGIETLALLEAPRDLGLAWNFKGMYAQAQRDYQQAACDLRESISLFEAAGDDWGKGYSLNDLGMATLLSGNGGEALRLGQESLAIFRRIGDRRGMAFALHNLGVVSLQLGELDEARALFNEALAVRRQINHAWGIAATLIQLGVLDRLAGSHDASLEHLGQALASAALAQSRPTEMRALLEVAAVLIEVGEAGRAGEILRAVIHHPVVDREMRERVDELMRDPAMLDMDLAHIAPDEAEHLVEEHARAVQTGHALRNRPLFV